MYIILCSAVLQTIGFGLLASLLKGFEIPARIYGFEVIAGFGCGININMLLLTVPFTVEFRDKAVGMGAVSQLRPMGGAIVLAIATSVFNGSVRSRLAALGITNTLRISGDETVRLVPERQDAVRDILARGYNLQMIVLCVFAAAQIPTTMLMFRRNPIRV